MLSNGGNIAGKDHNGIVNGSYSFLKHFDIKLNGKKVYDCNDANHAVNIKNLLEYSLSYAEKKQQVMSFSSLIYPEIRKSGNLKLAAQIS